MINTEEKQVLIVPPVIGDGGVIVNDVINRNANSYGNGNGNEDEDENENHNIIHDEQEEIPSRSNIINLVGDMDKQGIENKTTHQVSKDIDVDNDIDGDVDHKGDDASCCSLVGSAACFYNYENETENDSLHGSMVYFDSSHSICSSLPKVQEHVGSRMNGYGIFDPCEKKKSHSDHSSNRSSSNSRSKSVSNSQHAVSVNSGLTDVMTESSGTNNHTTRKTSLKRRRRGEVEKSPTRIPLHIQVAVEETHKWLFTEGSRFEDVRILMMEYYLYLREHLRIPLDRLYYFGVGLHPEQTVYLWKWDTDGAFTHSELKPEIVGQRNENFGPYEPFRVLLEEGRADHVRIKDDTSKWFKGEMYKDCFALPDIYKGVSRGCIAWSTKSTDGFCDDDIRFFQMTNYTLATILRLHTNDLILETLKEKMEAEIEDRNIKLANANHKLAEANLEISMHSSKQLEHFACMSHEIRTPLNCIVGLSSLLMENEDLNEEFLDTINMIYNSADLVRGVVNDVLDYAKIESGHFELDVRPCDLQTTLNDVVHSMSNKLRDKNIDVRTSYCGTLGKTMTTDSMRLKQILNNIMGNAAKFSKEGTTIDFKVKVVQEAPEENTAGSENKRKIRFSIKDYGKGIEEENFEKIFQPFSQASKETQTIYGGTGLGLSISKKLVSRLGGIISIKSKIGEYTEVIIELPYNEELADASRCKEKMSETSIVILDPTEQSSNASPTEEDEFAPFPTKVIKQYNLSVVRCSSWGELESKLGLRANIRENYVFLAHEDIDECQGVLNVEKIISRERCSWFTFGADSCLYNESQHHFKTLTEIFPSTLIDKIYEGMTVQRETGFGNLYLKESSESKSLTMQEKREEIKQRGEADIESRFQEQQQRQESEQEFVSVLYGSQTTNANTAIITPNEADRKLETSSSINTHHPYSSTKSKKKFASKYPQRALKILIVDNNSIHQNVLDRTLKRLGITDITIVDNGKKAVNLTENDKFDCIFMEVEMPVMDGLEASKLIIGRDKETARVAFVTAHDIEDIREKADAVGAFGYISKPFNMTDIHEFLKLLENSKRNSGSSPVLQNQSKTVSTHNEESTPHMPPTPPTTAATAPTTASASKAEPTPPKKKKRSMKQYPPRNLRVLVAEDNLINQKVLNRILKRLGVQNITIVDNGKKAVDVSETTCFDCILMDMQMPIMDGLEACKIIEQRDQLKEDRAKIVFVTAHALAEFKEKALEAGAFDFITKPCKIEDIDNVLNIIESAMSESQKGSSSDTSSGSPTKE